MLNKTQTNAILTPLYTTAIHTRSCCLFSATKRWLCSEHRMRHTTLNTQLMNIVCVEGGGRGREGYQLS